MMIIYFNSLQHDILTGQCEHSALHKLTDLNDLVWKEQEKFSASRTEMQDKGMCAIDGSAYTSTSTHRRNVLIQQYTETSTLSSRECAVALIVAVFLLSLPFLLLLYIVFCSVCFHLDLLYVCVYEGVYEYVCFPATCVPAQFKALQGFVVMLTSMYIQSFKMSAV